VLIPGIDNLLKVFFDQLLRFNDKMVWQARLSGQFHRRLQPKLGLSVRVGHMDVHSRFFPREEKETKRPCPKNSWCQECVPNAADPRFYISTHETVLRIARSMEIPQANKWGQVQ